MPLAAVSDTVIPRTVRHLFGWELPAGLWPGFELRVDYRWVWGVVNDLGIVDAVVITAPAHGMLLFLRLWKAEAAPASVIRLLFDGVARDALALDFDRWMCIVSGRRREELKLAKLALRFNARHEPSVGLMCYGMLRDLCRGKQSSRC